MNSPIAIALVAAALSTLSLGIRAESPPAAPAVDFAGEYVDRDFPAFTLSVGAHAVRLSEGTKVELEGRIAVRSADGFLVAWRDADRKSFGTSRFEAEYTGSTFLALRETSRGLSASDRRAVYLPAGKYRPGSFSFVSGDGAKLTVAYDLGADEALVWLPDGRVFELPLDRSASGARYANGRQTYWEHQGSVVFEIDGKAVFEGRLAGH